MRNKTYKELHENLLYTSADKADFLDDDNAIINAFMINFVGVALAFNLSLNQAKVLRYIKADKKVRLANITDENNDMSLIIKIMSDKKMFKNNTVTNEITRFLAKLKTGSIDNIDEGILLAWINQVKDSNMIGMQKSLKKALATIVDDGDLTLGLKHIRWSAMRNKKSSGEFLDLTRGMRFKQVNKTITPATATATATNQPQTDSPDLSTVQAPVVSQAPTAPEILSFEDAMAAKDNKALLKSAAEKPVTWFRDFTNWVMFGPDKKGAPKAVNMTQMRDTLSTLGDAFDLIPEATITKWMDAIVSKAISKKVGLSLYNEWFIHLINIIGGTKSVDKLDLAGAIKRAGIYDIMGTQSLNELPSFNALRKLESLVGLRYKPSDYIRENLPSLKTVGIGAEKTKNLIRVSLTLAYRETDVVLDMISDAKENPFINAASGLISFNVENEKEYDTDWFRSVAKFDVIVKDDGTSSAVDRLINAFTTSQGTGRFGLEQKLQAVISSYSNEEFKAAVTSLNNISAAYDYEKFYTVLKAFYYNVLQRHPLASSPDFMYMIFKMHELMVLKDYNRAKHDLISQMVLSQYSSLRQIGNKIIRDEYTDPKLMLTIFADTNTYGNKLPKVVEGARSLAEAWKGFFNNNKEISILLFKEYVNHNNVPIKNMTQWADKLEVSSFANNNFKNGINISNIDAKSAQDLLAIGLWKNLLGTTGGGSFESKFPELVGHASDFILKGVINTIMSFNSVKSDKQFFLKAERRLNAVLQLSTYRGLIQPSQIKSLSGYDQSLYTEAHDLLLKTSLASLTEVNADVDDAKVTLRSSTIDLKTIFITQQQYIFNDSDYKSYLKDLLQGAHPKINVAAPILDARPVGSGTLSEFPTFDIVKDDPELQNLVVNSFIANGKYKGSDIKISEIRDLAKITKLNLDANQSAALELQVYSIIEKTVRKQETFYMTSLAEHFAADDASPMFKDEKVIASAFSDMIARLDSMPNTVAYREARGEIIPFFSKVLMQSGGEVKSIYDTINNKYKKEIAGAMVQERAMKILVEGKIENENSPIKPLVSVTPERLTEILKFNHIDIPGDKVKVSDVRTYDELITYTTDAVKGVSLNDMSVEEVEMDSAQLERLTADMHRAKRNGVHGKAGMKIRRVFKAELPLQVRSQEAWIDDDPTQEIINPMYHGTGSIAASIILRNGFAVIKSGDASVVGRMLGDGVYGAIHIDKSQQYIGDAGYSRNAGMIGYIFAMNAALGKKGKDYDAAGVDGGNSNFRVASPEWCVFTPNAQFKIETVYEVEIADDAAMQEILKNNKEEVNEAVSFSNFITEAKTTSNKQLRFTFVNGRVPIGKSKVVEFEDFKGNKNVYIEKSAYGPVVVMNNTKNEGSWMYKSPTDFQSNDPDKYKQYLSLLKKKLK